MSAEHSDRQRELKALERIAKALERIAGKAEAPRVGATRPGYLDEECPQCRSLGGRHLIGCHEEAQARMGTRDAAQTRLGYPACPHCCALDGRHLDGCQAGGSPRG